MCLLRSGGSRESTPLTAGPARRRIRPGGTRLPRRGQAVSAPVPSGTSVPRRWRRVRYRLCHGRPGADEALADPRGVRQRSAALTPRRPRRLMSQTTRKPRGAVGTCGPPTPGTLARSGAPPVVPDSPPPRAPLWATARKPDECGRRPDPCRAAGSPDHARRPRRPATTGAPE
jgi:hypothetical protein